MWHLASKFVIAIYLVISSLLKFEVEKYCRLLLSNDNFCMLKYKKCMHKLDLMTVKLFSLEFVMVTT